MSIRPLWKLSLLQRLQNRTEANKVLSKISAAFAEKGSLSKGASLPEKGRGFFSVFPTPHHSSS